MIEKLDLDLEIFERVRVRAIVGITGGLYRLAITLNHRLGFPEISGCGWSGKCREERSDQQNGNISHGETLLRGFYYCSNSARSARSCGRPTARLFWISSFFPRMNTGTPSMSAATLPANASALGTPRGVGNK